MKKAKEIAEAVRRLNELPGYIGRDIKALTKYAAEPMLAAAKLKAPKSSKVHYRYKNGERIAYRPGNLKRSIRFLPFRKTRAVFIGPTLGAAAAADGYYSHFVEFGTASQPAQPYMRPAFDETKPFVVERLGKAIAKKIKPWETKYSRKK